MTRLARIIAVIATAAAALTIPTAQADPSPTDTARTSTTSELPGEIPRGVELTLADADTLRIWASKNSRVVWAKRREATTGGWGERRIVLKEKNLFCGAVEARTSAGAVAAIAKCDRYGYADDQAPVSSRALWSADTVSWDSFKLSGEAFEEPGISPDGTNAVWPLYGGYAVRTSKGFTHHRLAAKRQQHGDSAVIDDNRQVSLFYPLPAGVSRCDLAVLSPAPDATVDRQVLAIPSCDAQVENLDVDTVLVGDTNWVEDTSVVQRSAPGAPWAVTRIAPTLTPGLVSYSTTGADTHILAASGLPLLALGSENGRRWTAQTYDSAAQQWNARTTIFRSPRGCVWEPLQVQRPTDVALERIRCGRSRRLLVTTDATTWHTPIVGKHPPGTSPTRHWVSASSASGTTIYSQDRGAVSLPLPVTGACDVVVPTGPGSAVRLTTGRGTGWPSVIQRSTPGGWMTTGRLSNSLPRTCRHADLVEYYGPAQYLLQGNHAVSARLRWVLRGGALIPLLRRGF